MTRSLRSTSEEAVRPDIGDAGSRGSLGDFRTIWSCVMVPLGLTIAITLLDAAKPQVSDDGTYYFYATNFAAHPLNPYGFLFGGVSAYQLLAPPALLYWLAGATRLFGSDPVILKLSLAPLVALLVWGSYGLAKRFCRGFELPVLIMLVSAPATLPNWNMMLDMPALALSVGALNLFIWACDAKSGRRSAMLAIAAGLLVGIAAETKYTAFVTYAALVLYGVLRWRVIPTLLVATVGLATFVATEAWLASLYGQSQFLLQLTHRAGSLIDAPRRLFLRLVSLLGALGCWLLPLALATLGASRRLIVLLACFVPACFLLIAVLPPDPVLGMPVATWLYGAAGIAFVAVGIAVALRLFRERTPIDSIDSLFLIGWLTLAVGGYFTMFPFAAAARLIAILFVATLIVGRLAARKDRQRLRAVATLCAALCLAQGVLFALVDIRDAIAHQRNIERAVAWIRERDSTGNIFGYGYFNYYADRLGMRMIPTTRCTPCRPGDWTVIDELVDRGFVRGMEKAGEITEEDGFPLQASIHFYFGGTPLVRLSGPRATAEIYRMP